MYSFKPPRGAEMNDQAPLTITVPEAGKRYFGLSRDASYAAAQRGDIPTIRIGRLLRVPVRAMERLLDSSSRGRTGGAAGGKRIFRLSSGGRRRGGPSRSRSYRPILAYAQGAHATSTL